MKNSNDIVLILNCLNVLDENMFLFTAYSIAIHPNINTEEGLTFLTLALNNLMFKVNHNLPRKETITTIKLLLRFNVFQFEDAYYRRKEGEEMGSPFTCLWEFLTFSKMEMLVFIPKFKKNVAVFKRRADDMFLIWRKHGEHENEF